MRQQYIDILKGFTIIWVLWMHMDMPELIYPSVQMPIFFFLSGTFFRAKSSFREQIINDGYRLLVPTVCFMAIVAILMTLRGDNLWSYNIIEVLQTCRNGSITWFLICLFCLRTLNYPFEKYRLKWWYLALATIVYPIGYYWKVKYPNVVVPIIPVVEMFMFGIYYVTGYIFGKKVLELALADNARNVSCYLLGGGISFVRSLHGLGERFSKSYSLAGIWISLYIKLYSPGTCYLPFIRKGSTRRQSSCLCG